jgi:RNA polymerase-binding transcription factor DksA
MSAELDAVEAALARLDRGSFDTCELCGGRIGQDRLLEDPLLTRCPSHG